jgi:trehalose 6-phosphate phosphatase
MSESQDPGALLEAARRVLAEPRAALLTDLDGTLSAIAPRPELAVVQPGVRRALRALRASLALVAVLSGRRAAEARRLVGVAGVVYVGNHGLEAVVGRRRWVHPEAAAFAPQLARVVAAVEARLARHDLYYEVKGLTASIHYRGAAAPARARAAILRALAELPEARDVRVTEGRCVVELRPPVAASKGSAVGCLLRRYAVRAVLLLGDDRTDLDAVRALQQARARGEVRGLTIAVASSETPPELLAEADATVDGVAAVEALLGGLAATR